MPDNTVPLPDFTRWPSFPFEGDMRVKRLAPAVEVEPPRSGEDAGECVACGTPDEAYIWVSERWRVRAMDRPTGLPMVLILECRSHLDLGDLPNLLAAELGVMTVRLERAIRSLDGVARVHVNRWGDGSAHLHLWFLARPYGRLQLRGTFLSLWDDILPVIPEQQWRENLALVAAWLAEFGGQAIAEPPHIQWQAPSRIAYSPDAETDTGSGQGTVFGGGSIAVSGDGLATDTGVGGGSNAGSGAVAGDEPGAAGSGHGPAAGVSASPATDFKDSLRVGSDDLFTAGAANTSSPISANGAGEGSARGAGSAGGAGAGTIGSADAGAGTAGVVDAGKGAGAGSADGAGAGSADGPGADPAGGPGAGSADGSGADPASGSGADPAGGPGAGSADGPGAEPASGAASAGGIGGNSGNGAGFGPARRSGGAAEDRRPATLGDMEATIPQPEVEPAGPTIAAESDAIHEHPRRPRPPKQPQATT